MNYAVISKETFDLLYKSRASLSNSPLDPAIRTLAELRVSQINECAYCCRLHTEEAQKIGVNQGKLDSLFAWQNSVSFSEKEKAALQWVESVTLLDKNLGQARKHLLTLYSERECVDLTACIGIMNALNRIVISLRD
jgi:AhpD family alkylhydroperoxidase